MTLEDLGLTEADFVDDPAIMDHPAMLPASQVKLPKPVEEMTHDEFREFGRKHFRWFLETYGYYRPSGVLETQPIVIKLTPHQVRMLAVFVQGWFIDETQQIVVVGKHRRAYTTTLWAMIIWALTHLYPGLNAFIGANSWKTTRESIKEQMVQVYEDCLPPMGSPEKRHPFDTPMISAPGDDTMRWARTWDQIEDDEETGLPKLVTHTSNVGGSYIMFKSVGSKEGAVSREVAVQLFSEGGMSGPGIDWDLVWDRSANAMPKQGACLMVVEGTGEERLSFLNRMIDIAQQPDNQYVFVMLHWYDDPAMWLENPKQEKILPVGNSAKDKERDAYEIERIVKAFREEKRYDEISEADRQKWERVLRAALYYRMKRGLPRLKYSTIRWNTDFPTTREDMRPVSKSTVFDVYVLEDMKTDAIKRAEALDGLPDAERPLYPVVLPVYDDNGKAYHTLHLLHEPGYNAQRVICVDASEGVPGNDPNAITCCRFERGGKVVLEAVHDGYVDGSVLAKMAFILSDYYRDPWGNMSPISVEDEQFGGAVIRDLQNMKTEKGETPPLYRMRTPLQDGNARRRIGFDMNTSTRQYGIKYLKAWMKDWVIDYLPIFDQLGTFGVTASGKIKGLKLYPDDLVLCLVQTAYIGVEWGKFSAPKPVLGEAEEQIIRRSEIRPEERIDLEKMLADQYPQLPESVRKRMITEGIELPERKKEKQAPTFREIAERSATRADGVFSPTPVGDMFDMLAGKIG